MKITKKDAVVLSRIFVMFKPNNPRFHGTFNETLGFTAGTTANSYSLTNLQVPFWKGGYWYKCLYLAYHAWYHVNYLHTYVYHIMIAYNDCILYQYFSICSWNIAVL